MKFSVSIPMVGSNEHTSSAVGVDIQVIEEIGESLERFGERFTARLFTRHEIEACDANIGDSARYFAEGFAAKEAVLKILDAREFVPPWKSIELHRGSDGPQIELHGSSSDLARGRGIRNIYISLSHSRDTVIAVAVAHSASRPDDSRA